MILSAALDAVLVVMAVAHVVAALLMSTTVFAASHRRIRSALSVTVVAFGSVCCAAVVFGSVCFAAVVFGCERLPTTVVGVVGAGAVLTATWRMRRFRPAGAVVWSSFFLMGAALSVWGVHFLAGLPVSPLTRSLLVLAAALGAVTLPSSVLQALEGWEVLLCDEDRSTGKQGPVADVGPERPKVSIHVPDHAEPPPW
jgi:hypothetical protein